jgi:hypothetical protein
VFHIALLLRELPLLKKFEPLFEKGLHILALKPAKVGEGDTICNVVDGAFNCHITVGHDACGRSLAYRWNILRTARARHVDNDDSEFSLLSAFSPLSFRSSGFMVLTCFSLFWIIDTETTCIQRVTMIAR